MVNFFGTTFWRPLAPRTRKVPYALITFALSAIILGMALLAMQAEQERSQERILDHARHLSGLLERHIGEVFRELDIVLQTVVYRYREQALDSKGLNAFLDFQQSLVPEILGLRVTDAAGNILLGRDLAATAPVNVSDRDYFQCARQSLDLCISQPFVARISRQWAIAFARRLTAADGSFAGVVFIYFPVTNFQATFSAIGLGAHGAATIRSTDLSLVYRYPDEKNAYGSKETSRQLRDAIRDHPEGGDYVAATALDGILRRNVFRRIQGLPFQVIVGLADVDESGVQREKILVYGGLAGSAVVITCFAVILVYRADRRNRLEIDERMAAEARFRSLVEGTSDWSWETGIDHRITWLSPSAESVLGRAGASLLGKRRWDLNAPQQEADPALWQSHQEDLAACRAFRDFRYWLDDNLGGKRWISVSGAPRFGEKDDFLGYRGSGSDITAWAAQSQRVSMLSTAVEQSPLSVVITDPAGNIEYVNLRFSAVSGYAAEEVIGRNPSLLASGETAQPVYREMWETIGAGRRWEGELRNRRKDGGLHWESMIIAPVLNAGRKIAHYVAFKTDVTERRDLQEKLRRTNAELEQFAYIASHDLRQPLRMVASYLGLIEKRLGPDLDGELKKFLDFAVGGAKRMDNLIISLLAYSRTGKTGTPEPVALGQVVENVLANLTVAITEAEARVVIDEALPTVPGNPVELARLIQNLIANALKFRAADRPVQVELRCRRDGGAWLLEVRDNGIGIREEDRERAFALFQRLESGQQFEGTGIGLAVCRKIVENHGGRIWIESTVGVGSSFFVALPA